MYSCGGKADRARPEVPKLSGALPGGSVVGPRYGRVFSEGYVYFELNLALVKIYVLLRTLLG